MKPYEWKAASLLTVRAHLGWDDPRMQEEIRKALYSAFCEGVDEGVDESDGPAPDPHIQEAGLLLLSQALRLRDIRSGVILHADLNDELEKLCDSAFNKAQVFGVVP